MSKRRTSPKLELTITEDMRERAIQSNSGGCLVADAIKQQYPHLSNVSIDMATIRVSDSKAGVRYTYLTPPDAQHVLLAFDQGWPNPTRQLTIRTAVKIDPIIRPNGGKTLVGEARRARIVELETKVASGTASVAERRALTRLRKRPEIESAPSKGPTVIVGRTLIGGERLRQGPPHPNLLRGRNRHFGARLADPGRAFEDAVEREIERRAEQASDEQNQEKSA